MKVNPMDTTDAAIILGGEEDDEEGLSEVTKESIRKAEEEYERYKDDDSEDDYENVREKIEDCFIIADTEISPLPYTYEVIN